MEDKTKLTDEQVSKVYNELAEVDQASTNALKKAEEETESSNYTELEKIETESYITDIGSINAEVNESTDDYKELFEQYNLTENDVKSMIDIVDKFKRNIDMNYYQVLPESLKNIADGMRSVAIKQGVKASKNDSARFILNELVHDAKMNNAFNTYIEEINATALEMDEQYKLLISDAFNQAFNKINDLEVSDPEQAKKLKAVKAAFEDAISFNKQLQYVEKTTANKLQKYAKKYSNETAYFNNLVNVTDVKIPDIRELPQIIYKALPQFSINEINVFIVVICKSVYNIDMENIVDLAYIYKMISSIYDYKFTNNYLSEDAEKLFGNIAKVITAIINK